MASIDQERRSALGGRFPALLIAGAGLLGLGGVAVSAAATHAGGGSLASTAGQFCLLHAAVVLALAAALRREGASKGFALAAILLLVGTIVFAADLALAGFTGRRPVPLAAPIGGTLMMAGWVLTAFAGLAEALTRPK